MPKCTPPPCASISTREFIRLNKPNNEELLAVPLSSPDLNMCDYYLWKAIQDRLQPRYGTRVELRADVLRQTCNLPLDEIWRSICSWSTQWSAASPHKVDLSLFLRLVFICNHVCILIEHNVLACSTEPVSAHFRAQSRVHTST